MATIELGTFLVFVIVPFLALVVMRFLKGWGWPGMVLGGMLGLVGFAMISGMALLMFFEYDVVISKEVPVLTATATTETADSEIYSMNVLTGSAAYSMFNGGNTVRAEYASNSTSSLVGDYIECISLPLRKVGSPTGSATIGTFDGSGNVVTTFGTQDVSTLTTAFVRHEYCLAAGQLYEIQSGDRIGVKYTGGDASNRIETTADDSNPFDGVISYRQHYAGGWFSSTTSDVSLQLYRGTNETTTATANTYGTEPETMQIINSDHNTIGWILFALALLMAIVSVKVIFVP